MPVPRHRRSGVSFCLGPAAKSGTITTITTERIASNPFSGYRHHRHLDFWGRKSKICTDIIEHNCVSATPLQCSKLRFVIMSFWSSVEPPPGAPWIDRERWQRKRDELHADLLKQHAARHQETDGNRFRRYGLSVVEHRRLIAQQNGVCEICREPEREGYELSVDHDHKTGRVRSLLCLKCNLAIGFLRESPLLARAAAMYLEQQLTKEFTGE